MARPKLEEQIKYINSLKPEKHNIIALCDYKRLPKLHQLIIEIVNLSGDPNDGDIYKHTQSKKWCLHHQAKLKLAMAAAIQWNSMETKPVVIERDYIHFQAVAHIIREYGRIVSFRGDGEIDLLRMKEDLFDKYRRQAKDKDMNDKKKAEWIEYCAMRDWRQQRQHRMKLVATGAKSVVIDKILNLKPGYPDKNELIKPWVVVRCEIAPDLENEEIANRLSMMALQQAAGIYGPRQIGPPADTHMNGDTGPVVDVAHKTVRSDFDDDAPGETAGDEEVDGSPPDFESLQKNDQVSELYKMMKRSGYDKKRLQGRKIENMDEVTRTKFHDHLKSMIDEDIPF